MPQFACPLVLGLENVPSAMNCLEGDSIWIYFTFVGIPIMKMRRSCDRLIFIMGIPILVIRLSLYWISSWCGTWQLLLSRSHSPLYQITNQFSIWPEHFIAFIWTFSRTRSYVAMAIDQGWLIPGRCMLYVSVFLLDDQWSSLSYFLSYMCLLCYWQVFTMVVLW